MGREVKRVSLDFDWFEKNHIVQNVQVSYSKKLINYCKKMNTEKEIPEGYCSGDCGQNHSFDWFEFGGLCFCGLDCFEEYCIKQGKKQFIDEIKEKQFWKEGKGTEQITYKIEVYEYPHDENCEGSMCWCESRAKKKNGSI